MPQSMTHQLPLATLADMATHPMWTATTDHTNQTVTFQAYVHHHPVGCPRETFGRPFQTTIEVVWNDTKNCYMYTSPAKYRHQQFPRDRYELQDALTTEFEKSQKTMERDQFPRRKLTSSIVSKLQEKYSTYYNVLTTPPAQLDAIHGIGATRLEYLKDGVQSPQRNHPQWCWLSRCPECTEEWWSTQHTTDHATETISEKPSLDPLQEKMYCPNCLHAEIPSGYFTGPYPFTTETLASYTGDSPSRETSSGATSLSEFL